MNTMKRAAELLKGVQWQYRPYDGHWHTESGYYCPECDGKKENGHTSKCELLAVITELESVEQVGLIDGVDSNHSGSRQFFAYDDEVGFERFNTEAEAKKSVQESIDEYRAIAAEGWPEEVENLCWGIVLGTTKEVPLADSEGNTTDLSGDRCVDYTLTDYTHPAPVNQQMLEALKELRDAYQEFMGVPAVKANAAIAGAEAARQAAEDSMNAKQQEAAA